MIGRRWLVVPAVGTPTALIGGWLLAAALQPAPGAVLWATISDLAAGYARYPEIMTAALAITGLGLLAIAFGLRQALPAGRAALALSGAGVLGVAAAPLPDHYELHALFAFVALSALSCWPLLGARRGDGRLGHRSALRAGVLGLTLLAVLYLAPNALGGFGVVEKLLAGGEITWLGFVAWESAHQVGADSAQYRRSSV